MKPTELRGIYEVACQAKGYEANDGQYKIWQQILGWCERKDLEQALAWYFETETKFPMPAELKGLAGRAMWERTAKSSEKRYLVAFQCPMCLAGEAGYFTVNDSIEHRTCNSIYGRDKDGKRYGLPAGELCPADMQIVKDERPA